MSAEQNDLEVDALINDSYRTMSAHLRKEVVDVSKWSELVSRMRWAMMAQANRIASLEEAARSAHTMRDYFAAPVAAAEVASAGANYEAAEALAEAATQAGVTIEQRIAQNAYEVADAMLAERAKVRP